MEGENHSHKHTIHKLLAHSYSVYFLFFLIGIYLDFTFSVRFFQGSDFMIAGWALLILGTFLIIWAQKTSRNFEKENITRETFSRGPYSFTRTPTHLGLCFLMLGFGIIASDFFVILFTLLSLVVSRVIFLDKEERVLAIKYGVPYLEYKKMVRL